MRKLSTIFMVVSICFISISCQRENYVKNRQVKAITKEIKEKKEKTDINTETTIDKEFVVNLVQRPQLRELYKVSKAFLGDKAIMFMAIAIEESGWKAESNLAKNYNNLIGMRYPRARYTYAIGETESNYAIYKNWMECMLDFKVYIESEEKAYKRKTGKDFSSQEELYKYLCRNYNVYSNWHRDIKKLLVILEDFEKKEFS